MVTGASCGVLQGILLCTLGYLDLSWVVCRGPQAGRASSCLLGCLDCIVSRMAGLYQEILGKGYPAAGTALFTGDAPLGSH